MDDYAVRPNLDVSGVGSASGGVYQNVTIQGVSKIHHDIDCLRCDLEGVAEILGHVRAQVLSVQERRKYKATSSRMKSLWKASHAWRGAVKRSTT